MKTHNADVVPDIGVPMLILPGSRCYDCGYGQEHNAFNKSKKKNEHEEKVNVDHPQGNSRIGLTYN